MQWSVTDGRTDELEWHIPRFALLSRNTVKPVLFAWALFREFRDLGDFAKITGREYATTS